MTDPKASHPPLAGIRVIDAASLLWVVELERAAAREPVDHRSRRAYLADIQRPARVIEFQAVGGNVRGADLPAIAADLRTARE